MAKWGRVVRWQEVPQINEATGKLEKWYRYTVQTTGGGVFHVLVPEADTTREKLEPLLEKRATELDATLKL